MILIVIWSNRLDSKCPSLWGLHCSRKKPFPHKINVAVGLEPSIMQKISSCHTKKQWDVALYWGLCLYFSSSWHRRPLHDRSKIWNHSMDIKVGLSILLHICNLFYHMEVYTESACDSLEHSFVYAYSINCQQEWNHDVTLSMCNDWNYAKCHKDAFALSDLWRIFIPCFLFSPVSFIYDFTSPHVHFVEL